MGFFDIIKNFLSGKKDAASNVGDSAQEVASDAVDAQDNLGNIASKTEPEVDNNKDEAANVAGEVVNVEQDNASNVTSMTENEDVRDTEGKLAEKIIDAEDKEEVADKVREA